MNDAQIMEICRELAAENAYAFRMAYEGRVALSLIATRSQIIPIVTVFDVEGRVLG